MTDRTFVVVTTIQRPTPAMAHLVEVLAPFNTPLLAIGDGKGPDVFDLAGSELITLVEQQAGSFDCGRVAPTGHYARKNIGYLTAIARGATCIYETDDDNTPLSSWTPRSRRVQADLASGVRWINVYRYFTDALIWPRGFPLELVQQPAHRAQDHGLLITSSIQQGLADGSPDVDAIWRLVLDRPIAFQGGPSLALAPGSFCPFNSQSTWWWEPAFPLMYLPSYCSFRMTDIWRGFIAQRCLWEIGESVVFHAPEVFQERNVHRLLNDFRDEIPGYLSNPGIIETLLSLPLRAGPEHVGSNLAVCYESLVRLGCVRQEELSLAQTWLNDLAKAVSLRKELECKRP
jgi:hypothetical protein